jgi:hypothetical protein
MIITTITVVQVNHVSVNEGEEFVKEIIDELFVAGLLSHSSSSSYCHALLRIAGSM